MEVGSNTVSPVGHDSTKIHLDKKIGCNVLNTLVSVGNTVLILNPISIFPIAMSSTCAAFLGLAATATLPRPERSLIGVMAGLDEIASAFTMIERHFRRG